MVLLVPKQNFTQLPRTHLFEVILQDGSFRLRHVCDELVVGGRADLVAVQVHQPHVVRNPGGSGRGGLGARKGRTMKI